MGQHSRLASSRLKVLLLSRYGRLGASSRLRSFQFLPFLTRAGLDVTVSSLLDDDYVRRLYSTRQQNSSAIMVAYIDRLWMLLRARRFDLLWIEKELFPWLPALAERVLFKLGPPYAVDYDDAIFHNYDLHRLAAVRAALGRKIDVVMRHAKLVIAGNEYLAVRARASGARWVELLPTVVDIDRYSRPPAPLQRHDHVIIGWIGSPSTEHYVGAVVESLRKVCAARGARVVLVGASKAVLPELAGEVWHWSEQTESDSIARFDIGIMPLSDEPWTRGKCGYKLIQYMVCGKPVVASPVGVNETLVRHGDNGYLARSADEWTNALQQLCDQPELRAAMGARGRKLVEEQYSVQAQGARLMDLLLAAANG